MSSPKSRKVTSSMSPKAKVSDESKSKSAKARRELRPLTFVFFVLAMAVLFVIAAVASEYIVNRMNASISERRGRAAKTTEESRGTSDGVREAADEATTGDAVKPLDPGLGDVFLPGTGPAVATTLDDEEFAQGGEQESAPATDESVSGQCDTDSCERQTSEQESKTSPPIATEEPAGERCTAAGDCERQAPSSVTVDTTQEDNESASKEQDVAAADANSLLGVDAGRGIEEWVSNEGNVEVLEKKLGMKIPAHHRSLKGADSTKCPFSFGNFKSRDKVFLVDTTTEEFRNRERSDNLTAVPALVEEKRAADVPVVQLRSGRSMPILGLGTHNVATRPGVAIMKTALNIGYRLFDTGYAVEFYSQDALGIAIKEQEIDRSELFISVKVDSRHYTAERFRAAVARSMQLLNVEYIDLLLLNDPYCGKVCLEVKRTDQGRWQDAWLVMEELREAGVARDLGVTAFGLDEVQELMELSDGRVSVVQSYFDPFHQDKELRELCRRNDVIYQGFATLGYAWTYADETLDGRNPVLTNDVIGDVAKQHNTTAAKVVLAWALDCNVSVIPGTMNLTHLQDNLAAADISLADDQLAAINALDGAMDERQYDIRVDHQSEVDRDVLVGTRASLELRLTTLRSSERGDPGTSTAARPLLSGDRALLVPLSSTSKAEKQFGRLLALDPETGDERWEFHGNGAIFAAPTVSADGASVYLGTADWHVYGLAAGDGAVQWDFSTNHSVAAPPLLDASGHVFALDMGGYMHVLARDSGKRERRQKYSDEGFLAAAIQPPRSTIYLTTLESYLPNFVAVNYATGETEYELELFGAASRAPVVSRDGKRVYAAGAGAVDAPSRVTCVSTTKQKKLWSKSISIQHSHGAAVALSRDDQVLYALHPSGFLAWYDARRGKTLGEIYVGEGVTMATPIPLNSTTVLVASGDGWLYLVCTHRQRYFEFINLRKPIIETPLLDDKKLYVSSRYGDLWKIDLPTKAIEWQKSYDKHKFNAPLTMY